MICGAFFWIICPDAPADSPLEQDRDGFAPILQRLAAHEARVAKLAGQGATLVFYPLFSSILERPVSEEVALLRACRYPAWFRPVASDRAALAAKSMG